MDDISYREASAKSRLQLAPHRVMEFQLVEFSSPIGWLMGSIFVFCMDTGAGNLTIDGLDKGMIWQSYLN